MDDHTIVTENWTEFCHSLDRKVILQAPFCGRVVCEENIKKDSARYICFINRFVFFKMINKCLQFNFRKSKRENIEVAVKKGSVEERANQSSKQIRITSENRTIKTLKSIIYIYRTKKE